MASDQLHFRQPTKLVRSPMDIGRWLNSPAYQDIIGFLGALSQAVANKQISDKYPVSQAVEAVLSLIVGLDRLVDETPAQEQPQRFGNKAFREWYPKMEQAVADGLVQVVGEELRPAIIELSAYLSDSFGNSTRIDFGTGHELSFVAFLICLCKLKIFTEEDQCAIVLRIFNRYLQLTRKLQLTYRMEPAGSQGVWSLDDFYFIAYIWGSAQLFDHQSIRPSSFTNADVCRNGAAEYIFLSSIDFINQVKTGPFSEHSNQLWNISGVVSWRKVNSGLIKMYKAEVLNKFPVIQHFLFGSMLQLTTDNGQQQPTSNTSQSEQNKPITSASMPLPTAAPGPVPMTAAPWAKQ